MIILEISNTWVSTIYLTFIHLRCVVSAFVNIFPFHWNLWHECRGVFHIKCTLRIFAFLWQHFSISFEPKGHTTLPLLSGEGYNFFLFTFFYLYSDLMAIKKRGKSVTKVNAVTYIKNNKKTRKRNEENHNARCDFQYTPRSVYTMSFRIWNYFLFFYFIKIILL